MNNQSGKIYVGFLKKTEAEQLASFYRDIYSPKHILLRREFFDWYTQTPLAKKFFKSNELPVLVVKEGKRVIGHSICQPTLFNYFGQPFSMFWISNWAVLPEFRSRGLSGFLIKALREQPVDVISANMVTPEVRRLLEYSGFAYQNLNRYLGIFSAEAALLAAQPARTEIKEKIKAAVIVNGGGNQIFSSIRKTQIFEDDWNRFWRSTLAPEALGPTRSAEFLNWRYSRDPFFRYEKFTIYDRQNRIQGALVLRIEAIVNTSARACRLLELLVAPDALSQALSFLLDYSHRQKCWFLDFYNLNSRFDQEFAAFGILKNDPVLSTALPRLTQPIAHENWFINAVFLKQNSAIANEDFLNFDRWYTTSGDADQDRKNFS